MGFPPTIVECAFSSDADEALYATGGWTEITPWIRNISGSLRGRQYEVNQSEAGVITVTLDNSDERFTPNEKSPYYPNVKPDRRFRIRGKNMNAANIATGGAANHTTDLFLYPDFDTSDTYTNGVSQPSWKTHTAGTVTAIPDSTDHIEVTVTNGQSGPAFRRMIGWLVPVETGTRLTHSAYIWKVSGTEPAGTVGRFEIHYFDNDDISILADQRPQEQYTNTPTTPTRVSFSHAPFGTVKYAYVVWAINQSAFTQPVTYAITGIQTELPANLAPNVSGQFDRVHWQVRGDGGETVGLEPFATGVEIQWNGSIALYQTIPHLIPGDTYSVAVETIKTGGSSDLMLTADEGQTGEVLTANDVWTTLNTVFVATQPQMDIEFVPSDPVASIGSYCKARGMRVEHVDNASLTHAYPLPVEATTWERPLDVFEGWVEAWPWKVTDTTSAITVVDRLKRLGQIELSNTLPETLLQDDPDLVIPFTDDPSNNPTGNLAIWGNWAEAAGLSFVALAKTKGDLSGATFELGVEGPTDEPSIDLNGLPATDKGYFFQVPYTKDYSAPTPTPPPPAPLPPQPAKKTYTRNYYATWSRSYEGDGSTRFDDSPYLYHGGFSSSNGNQRALIGFNHAAIRADLAGAELLSIKLTIRAEHTRWYAGEYFWFGGHNYSTKPSTWSDGTVSERRWKAWFKPDQTRTLTLSNQFLYELRNNSSKGVSVGPGNGGSYPQDDYGYFRGATQSAKPYLTITYKK